MKKLLLLLFSLLLSFNASTEVTYSSGIGAWYGDDGSECEETISGLICENYNGTVVTSYDKSGSTWYGDDGSECEMDLLDLICKSYYELNEYQIKAGERGRKTGEMLGQGFSELFNLFFGGNSNNKSNSQTLENGYFKNSIAYCNPGYDFKGYTDSNGYYKQRCVKNPCDIGYFKDRDTNTCMKVPDNANAGATSWYCKSGYRKYLDKCIKK
jgi:hypothetical protein